MDGWKFHLSWNIKGKTRAQTRKNLSRLEQEGWVRRKFYEGGIWWGKNLIRAALNGFDISSCAVGWRGNKNKKTQQIAIVKNREREGMGKLLVFLSDSWASFRICRRKNNKSEIANSTILFNSRHLPKLLVFNLNQNLQYAIENKQKLFQFHMFTTIVMPQLQLSVCSSNNSVKFTMPNIVNLSTSRPSPGFSLLSLSALVFFSLLPVCVTCRRIKKSRLLLVCLVKRRTISHTFFSQHQHRNRIDARDRCLSTKPNICSVGRRHAVTCCECEARHKIE